MISGEISPLQLFLDAGPVVKAVIIALIAASLWCWVIIFEALWTLSRLRAAIAKEGQSGGRLASAVARVFAEGRNEAALHAGEGDLASRQAAVSGVMRRRAQELVESCQAGLPNLAVIASVAPFVGLFGTVWGIMTSFAGIAAAKDTSLAVVAPGIAEALAATAIGLAAAIPAAFAYNRLSAAFGRSSRAFGRLIEDRAGAIAREAGHATPPARRAA